MQASHTNIHQIHPTVFRCCCIAPSFLDCIWVGHERARSHHTRAYCITTSGRNVTVEVVGVPSAWLRSWGLALLLTFTRSGNCPNRWARLHPGTRFRSQKRSHSTPPGMARWSANAGACLQMPPVCCEVPCEEKIYHVEDERCTYGKNCLQCVMCCTI